MQAYTYTFKASKNLDPDDIHALWNFLTDGTHRDRHAEEFKIQAYETIVGIITRRNIASKKFRVGAVHYELTRKQAINCLGFKAGDFVQIEGTIVQNIHETQSNREFIPITKDGNLKRYTAWQFIRRLEFDTGLLLSEGTVVFNISRGRDIKLKKVRIKAPIKLKIIAKVVNAEKLNTLAIRAIGQKKSYGFGSLSVVKAGALDFEWNDSNEI